MVFFDKSNISVGGSLNNNKVNLFYHNSSSHLNKYRIDFGFEDYKKNYVAFCKEHSYRLFVNYCGKERLFNLESVPNYDLAILTAFESNFQEKWDGPNPSYFFSHSFDKELDDCVSVLELVDGKFGFLYNDCIFNFNYILSMVEALNYTLMVSPYFFNSFISK